MGDFEIIMIIVAGIQTLPQLIIGHRMKRLIVDPPGVISVNHLAHEPEILLFLTGHPTQLLHEIKLQAVCAVQTDTVDIELVNPEPHHIQKIILHAPIPEIQVRQLETVVPGLVVKAVVVMGIALEAHILIPVTVRGILPVFLNIPECEKFAAGVIKDAVYHHPDAIFMAKLYEMLKILIVAQAAVHLLIIPGIVTVAGGFKQRSDIGRRESAFLHVPHPVVQLPQPVGHAVLRVGLGRAQKSQRINMIKNGFFIPFGHLFCPPLVSLFFLNPLRINTVHELMYQRFDLLFRDLHILALADLLLHDNVVQNQADETEGKLPLPPVHIAQVR